MKQLFLTAVLLAFPVWAVPASLHREGQRKISNSQMRILVRRAMAQARRGHDDTPSMRAVGRSGARALPFLEPYSHDNNDNVRRSVMESAERFHSPIALQLLSNVLVRPENLEMSNVGLWILSDISIYNRTELSHWGGAALQNRLMQLANRGGFISDSDFLTAIYLLPAFPGARTSTFLQTLHRKPARVQPGEQDRLPRAPRPFAADLALAEMGEDEALQRLQRGFAWNTTNERVWLCQALPFIENKKLLRLVPAFLNDTRPVKRNEMCVMNKQGAEIVILPPTRMWVVV